MTSKTYNLDSVLDFGKYEGHVLSDAIEQDPVYFNWLSQNKKDFNLSPSAEDAHANALKQRCPKEDLLEDPDFYLDGTEAFY